MVMQAWQQECKGKVTLHLQSGSRDGWILVLSSYSQRSDEVLELRTAVRHHVGAGNQTQFLCKSKCSYHWTIPPLLSHFIQDRIPAH